MDGGQTGEEVWLHADVRAPYGALEEGGQTDCFGAEGR